MLSYELCKELKDAGFPQPLLIRKCEHHGFVQRVTSMTEDVNTYDQIQSYSPTLSELIEAVGNKFLSLDSPQIGDYYKNQNLWAATGMRGDEELWTLGEGSTPEEAVARLYLSLKRI